jgi:DUF1365 family protein
MKTQHIQAETRHARRGKIKNAFRYGVDFVLTDLRGVTPALLSRNRFNLWSVWDRHHGGPRTQGKGRAWFEEILKAQGFEIEGAQILLLTQPSFLWFHFNPVSFWIALGDGHPRAFVAEVNSTFGQRHCYFCAHEGFGPIERHHRLTAKKLMHVSPFQTIAGQYRFNFGLTEARVDIRISYENGDQGVLATLAGDRHMATNTSLLRAALRRPMGALRVLALIHWQAAILYVKRAPFLRKQPAPATAVSSCQSQGETGS